ncbi:MAG: murein biosynthesis integral membrane protein MurJ [Verrucomicrobiota bacterium]
MPRNLQNIAVVSLSTVGSRVFGLVRDIMIFAALGASIWSSAFFVAFTLPNLFRRLLGEGALTSAVVPLFSEVLKQSGKARAFSFLNTVLFRLFFALVVLTFLLVLGLSIGNEIGLLHGRWSLASRFTATLVPYMIFICLAAIVAAVLNILGRFFSAACTPILLNIAMISSLGIGLLLDLPANQLIWWLCGGVLIGGFLQLIVPVIDLLSQGWRPKPEQAEPFLMQELWRLFLPGLLGAAILQLNILVSRLLAFSLDESATSILYLASRLMELPLGVFTLAVVTVFFPLMAKAFAERDEKTYTDALLSSMRLVMAISVPAGVGLIVLGQPIVSTLFQWGAFDNADVAATVPLIAIYGFGLPFYSVATLATRGLHAGKEMKAPVRVAIICLLVNALSGLVLMQFFGASGLASANVIAAVIQSVLLWRYLSDGHPLFQFIKLKKSLLQILAAGMAMGLFCLLINLFFTILGIPENTLRLVLVFIIIPSAAALYFTLLLLLRFEDMKFFQKIISRFI